MNHLPNLPPSSILPVLGPDLFAPFTAVEIPGQVIWCNFELARGFGFDVPRSNQMSPGLHQELIRAFSYRSLRPGEDPAGRPTMTLYADRYGGDGVAPGLGSSRGGFYPYCNAFAKGVGLTPLFRHYDPADFVHSHGGMDMEEALVEALWGEVNVNLFSGKTTRALVLIDQGDDTVRPNGRRTPRALTVRVCDQLRPAHILATRCWKRRSRLEVFLAVARETGQLVLQTGADGEPDLQATFLRIIDDHAWMAARQVRWRITHCYLSASNMRMDGGMLDHNTLRSNPRLPPIAPDRSFDPDRAFYGDYIDRTRRIATLYRTLWSSLTQAEKHLLNAGPIEIGRAMDTAYRKRLEHELLCAAGIKSAMASRIQETRPDVAGRFARILTEMTGVGNRAATRANRRKISDAAALDICSLLAAYPRTFFHHRAAPHPPIDHPPIDHPAIVWKVLRPHFKGNRFHSAKKRAAVEALLPEFITAYRDLMMACRDFAVEFYGGEVCMQRSIIARASFENRPIEPLYLMTLWQRANPMPRTRSVRGLAMEYRATGDPRIIRKAIDELAAEGMRNTEELLYRGDCRRLSGGDLESQVLIIDGVRYAVRSSSLHVSIPVEPDGTAYLTPLDRFPRLTKTALGRLRFRFTTDAWTTKGEAPAVLESDRAGGLHIAFRVPASAPMGELQGLLYIRGKNPSRVPDREILKGYVFAIPDRLDLEELSRRKASLRNLQTYTT